MILPVFGTAAVKKTATLRLVLDTVRDALVAHAEGRTSVPPPLHMDFPETDRDCHVKAGWITGATDFTIKIATGFYRNPALGLPVNHGLVCVVSARTGQVRALLDDRGLLTAWVPPPRARSSPMPWPGPAPSPWPSSAPANRPASRRSGWPNSARSARCSSTAATRTKPPPCATTSKRTACLPGRLRHNRRSPPTPAHRRRHRVSHQAGGASRWWTAGKSAE